MKPVKFARKFDHYVKGQSMTSYPAGFEGEVADDVEEAARKAGALAAPPSKPPAGTGGTDKP